MYKKKTIGTMAVSVFCIVMLMSTGMVSASQTTTMATKKQTYHDELREKLTERINAFNMTNESKLQLIRVLAFGGVAVLGLVFLLIPNKHKIKAVTLIKLIGISGCVGADIAIGATILLNMQKKQNDTNSTL
jgi:hypothetical protein